MKECKGEKEIEKEGKREEKKLRKEWEGRTDIVKRVKEGDR